MNFLASQQIHARTILLSSNKMILKNWNLHYSTMVLHSRSGRLHLHPEVQGGVSLAQVPNEKAQSTGRPIVLRVVRHLSKLIPLSSSISWKRFVHFTWVSEGNSSSQSVPFLHRSCNAIFALMTNADAKPIGSYISATWCSINRLVNCLGCRVNSGFTFNVKTLVSLFHATTSTFSWLMPGIRRIVASLVVSWSILGFF